MKTIIVGAGAIGGFIGVQLARLGGDVTALARGATAQSLREHGWRLDKGGERLAVPVQVVESPQGLAPFDLVVIALKAPALAPLAPALPPLIGPDTVVLSAMNGVPWWFLNGFGGPLAGQSLSSVDPGGATAAAIPAANVLGCVVHATCSTPEPGLVRHGFGGGLIVGEPAGGASPRAQALAALLCRAGFDATVSACIQKDIWYKLWGNMTMNPISALTEATADRVLDDPLVLRFTLDIMAEAAAIGARLGCPIDQSGEERCAVTRKLGAFKTSMLQDREAGKPLEIDALLAAVKEIAGKLEVPTPNMDALLGLVRLMARGKGLY